MVHSVFDGGGGVSGTLRIHQSVITVRYTRMYALVCVCVCVNKTLKKGKEGLGDSLSCQGTCLTYYPYR